jgi:hypothetical protein
MRDFIPTLAALAMALCLVAALYEMFAVQSTPDCRDVLAQAAKLNYALLGAGTDAEEKRIQTQIAELLARQCSFR